MLLVLTPAFCGGVSEVRFGRFSEEGGGDGLLLVRYGDMRGDHGRCVMKDCSSIGGIANGRVEVGEVMVLFEAGGRSLFFIGL